MNKSDFYEILCSYTPEKINEFISSKGKIKMINAITFLDDQTLQDMQLHNTQLENKKEKP